VVVVQQKCIDKQLRLAAYGKQRRQSKGRRSSDFSACLRKDPHETVAANFEGI